MTPPSDRHSSLRPIYVTWVLMFVAGISCLQFLIVAGLYWSIYGPLTINELMTVRIPEYSHAALYRGRVWYSISKIGPNTSPNSGTLVSFDPEKGDTSELGAKIPWPLIGLLAQDDRLWAVSANSVVLVEGERATEFKPKRLLNRACEPFLYQGQLATIDLGANGTSTLLLFQNDEWFEFSPVVIPSMLARTTNGKNALLVQSPNAASVSSQSTRILPLDVHVVGRGNQIHLFVSDGVNVAYRLGLEWASTSALEPANLPASPDISIHTGWEDPCSAPLQRSAMGKNVWKAALVDGEPGVITVSSSSTNPFQNGSLLAYRRKNDIWQKTAETTTPAIIELLSASDGDKTYFAGQSLMQTLRFYRLIDNELFPTGTVMKAPVAGIQTVIEQGARLYQWVYWPALLIFALGVSRLMRVYLFAEYQFGLTTVELASLTRRGIARAVDHLLFVIPSYLLTLQFGLASREQIEKDMDRFFDLGPNGMMIRYAWWFMSIVFCGLFILIVNSWLQGRWGVTLGKWICGIRTVRSTLRPCGFARAMLRELLLVADTLFGTTIIPVILLIAFTSCRQRAGDLVADTIVIRKGTTRADNDLVKARQTV